MTTDDKRWIVELLYRFAYTFLDPHSTQRWLVGEINRIETDANGGNQTNAQPKH